MVLRRKVPLPAGTNLKLAVWRMHFPIGKFTQRFAVRFLRFVGCGNDDDRRSVGQIDAEPKTLNRRTIYRKRNESGHSRTACNRRLGFHTFGADRLTQNLLDLGLQPATQGDRDDAPRDDPRRNCGAGTGTVPPRVEVGGDRTVRRMGS